MTQNDFAFRIDRWTDDGERIVEHVAGAEDFQIAMATSQNMHASIRYALRSIARQTR